MPNLDSEMKQSPKDGHIGSMRSRQLSKSVYEVPKRSANWLYLPKTIGLRRFWAFINGFQDKFAESLIAIYALDLFLIIRS
jgi:hypothetical protein